LLAVSANAIFPINQITNIFFPEVYQVESARANQLGFTLSLDAFKARFGWMPDWVMYNFIAGNAITILDPTMSDWTLSLGQKMVLPQSCSYATWQSTGMCSLEYTGLQPILQVDITIRAVIQSCSGWNAPTMTFDCYGNACPLLTSPFCTQDSQCPTGTICYDPSVLLAGTNVDLLTALFQLFTSSNPLNPAPGASTCSGSSFFVPRHS